MRVASGTTGHAAPLGILLMLWVIPILVVGAGGNFPLNDDFAYARATLGWLETGEFHRLDWTYVPLYTHAMIGVVAAWCLGPDFESLRVATLAFSLLAIVGIYALALTLRAPRWAALAAAALFATNPLLVNLSFTFMTDVPFVALLVWSLAATFHGIDRGEIGWAVLGLLLATAAMLSRQTGVALGLGCAAVVFWMAPMRARVVLVAGGLLAGVAAALAGDGDAGFRLDLLIARLHSGDSLVYSIVNGLTVVMADLGWFTLPLACLAWRSGPRRAMAGAALASVVVGVGLIQRLELGYPPGANLIYDLGLGPINLAGQEQLPSAPAWVWPALTVLGLASFGVIGVFLVSGIAQRWWSGASRTPWFVLASFVALFLGAHVIRVPLLDRYLLPVLAVVLVALASLFSPEAAPRRGEFAAVGAVAAFAGIAFFSWAGTHDYLAHHRARSALIDALIEVGATPRSLDAGFEFQGWTNYAATHEGFLHNERKWVTDDRYVVSLRRDRPGYAVLAERHYPTWLTPGDGSLYGLERSGP